MICFVMCVIEAVFELVNLGMMLKGRTEEHTTKQIIDAGDARQVVYTTTAETHPFFDPTQGIVYNIQSATTIISPCIMVIGGFLCYYTYKAFTSAMIAEPEDAPIWGGRGFGGYGGGGPAQQPEEPRAGMDRRGSGSSAPRSQRVGGQVTGSRLFEGAGHRL